MRLAILIIGVVVGLTLEVLILTALLRGWYRRFPLIFAYAIADFVTTLLELPSALDYVFKTGRFPTLPSIYWIVEVVMQALVYLVVMSLIYLATEKLDSRRVVRIVLFAGALLFAGVSFLVHHSPTGPAGEWMTPWTRDLSFAATILDLALWALLIARREKNPRLLMLSGGLGIQFTGEAIGSSIQNFATQSHSRAIGLTGAALRMLTFLAFLYIWWQALRQPPEAQQKLAASSVQPH